MWQKRARTLNQQPRNLAFTAPDCNFRSPDYNFRRTTLPLSRTGAGSGVSEIRRCHPSDDFRNRTTIDCCKRKRFPRRGLTEIADIRRIVFRSSGGPPRSLDLRKYLTRITACPRWRSAIHRDKVLRQEGHMPDKETLERAREDAREGKSPSTQAGEFVREEMHHIREGKHGAASTKQAIAIGLSKARRSGVKLTPPKGSASASTKKQAARDSRKGQSGSAAHPSRRRSRAVSRALKRKGHSAASQASFSRQAKTAARKRSPASRKRSATKAARTRTRENRTRA